MGEATSTIWEGISNVTRNVTNAVRTALTSPLAHIDAARQAAKPIHISLELQKKLTDLQTGRAPALALGRENDPEVVKFLQAVVGQEQTGIFDEALDTAVKDTQQKYHIDSVSGQVSTNSTNTSAAFTADGIVRDSMRAFVQKAREDGRITEEQAASVTPTFDASTKSRWLFFAAPLQSWGDTIPSDFLNTVDVADFARRRASVTGPLDSNIQARVDDILEFVNDKDNWKKLGLTGPINNLGALRIQKALQVIASVESLPGADGLYNYAANNPNSSAFGCYQFMASTVAMLKRHGVINDSDFPSAKTTEDKLKQDFAAIWLIGSSAKGRMVLDDIVEGKVDAAMKSLAMEWAGLPKDRSNASYYEGKINSANINYDDAIRNMTEAGGRGYHSEDASVQAIKI